MLVRAPRKQIMREKRAGAVETITTLELETILFRAKKVSDHFESSISKVQKRDGSGSKVSTKCTGAEPSTTPLANSNLAHSTLVRIVQSNTQGIQIW